MKRLVCICLSVCLVFISSFAISLGSSSTAEAATRTIRDASSANGDWVLHFNEAQGNVPWYEWDPSYYQGTMSTTGLAKYEMPLGLSIRNSNAGTGQYATGVLVWNIAINPDVRQLSYDWDAWIDYPTFQGEGFSWSYRPHGIRSGSVVVILDNYQCSSYGVPGPDWSFMLNAQFTNPIALGSNYDAYDMNATAMKNNVVVSDTPNQSLSTIIVDAITQSPTMNEMVDVLESIKDQDAVVFDDIATKLEDQGVQMDEMIDEQEETNNIITDFFGGFFDNLLNGLLGLFIPSSEYFGEWFDELKLFLLKDSVSWVIRLSR